MRISRRQFTALAAGTLGGVLAPSTRANEPLNRPGKARLHLGLAAYGFRDFFKDANHPRPNAAAAEKRIDLLEFIDYCAEHDCAAEATSYYFPRQVDSDFLLKLKRHAFVRGVELSGTAVGNTFTHPAGEKRRKEIEHVNQWIDHAALMGVPHIRVFAGNAEGQPLDAAKRNCIEALEECCAHAATKGVFLGIENHGGIVAEPNVLLEIVHAVKSPWLGINLDTGNFHTDDPYRDLERCAHHAVNVQVKTEIRARGREKTPADLPRLIKILREANYQGYLVLEYEAGENPYQAVPRILAELRALL
jgi:sugar phosphate isomerase/epimerase